MCDCSNHVEVESAESALIRAVSKGDFEGLISVSKTPGIGNIRYYGDTLIHIAVGSGNIKILEHLLNLEAFDINSYNEDNMTPLLTAMWELLSYRYSDLAIVTLLVEKGANVNLSTNGKWLSDGNTPLHYCIKYNLPQQISILLLENGADANIQNNRGLTVLHRLCENSTDLEVLCMLLCYGSDPNLRSFDSGLSSFEMCLVSNNVTYQEIFQDYVIHELDKIPINLIALVNAMVHGSPFIYSVMDNISVDFSRCYSDHCCWCYFANNVMFCRAEYLRKFFERFSYVLEELTCERMEMMGGHIEVSLWESKLPEKYYEVIDSLYVIYSSEPLVYFFLEEVDQFNMRNLIYHLVYNWVYYKLDVNPLSEVVLHMLSMGAQLTDTTLTLIYLNYGDTDFFRILLHMDIIYMADRSCSAVPIPAIIHEMKLTTVDAFLPWKSNVTWDEMEILAHFFVDARIKDFLMNSNIDEYKVKAEKIPEVPLLVELARNATRKHLMDFYKVRNSRQFYTILNWLPLCREHKAIIGLERKLYCLN